MLAFLSANWGTIVVAAIVVCVVALIVAYQIKSRKAGKPACGGDCGSCGGCAACANANKRRRK